MKKSSPRSPDYAKDWWKCEAIFDIAAKKKELAVLEELAASPSFWNSQNAAKDTIAKTNAIKAVTRPFDELSALADDASIMFELAQSEPEGEGRQQAFAEAAELVGKAEAVHAKLETQSLLNGPLDSCNAWLTLHAGAGGTESCDWANMLYRMYQRYCERNGFEVETADISPGDEAGISAVTFNVQGANAYGFLKAERGVHRLVRISPFDSNARRHTSFVSLDVIAELNDEVEVEIKDDDLDITTCRSSGAGGQHVNKTDSAIRIRHVPSGIVVECQAERSQHKNKAKAMSILKAKLYELEQDKKRAAMDKFYGEKGANAWGSQIRSYVLQPYTMAKDLRTGIQTGNVQAVLDGDIGAFIEGWLKWKSAGGSLAVKPDDDDD